MEKSNRILSVDIMRGLTLVLMLFVNDVSIGTYLNGLHMNPLAPVPVWLGHAKAGLDGMGLADWVFPGFLFMVGMSIPYAIGKRLTRGEPKIDIFLHILVRTISLLIIGVLMANSMKVNGEFTGISRNIWALIVYSGIFLIWYDYRKTEKNLHMISILRIAGVLMIIPMVWIFRSGETNGFRFNSWGIIGTIGWGYLAATLVYIATRDNISKIASAMVFFLALNVLSRLHLLDFMNPVKPVLGILINGNYPFIVMVGLFTSLILKKYSKDNPRKTFMIIALLGILFVVAGFIFRNWFIIARPTPSYALICNGISMILFAILFLIVDIRKKVKWALFLMPAGRNSLTVYLVPSVFYYIIWQFSLPFLFYKQSGIPLVVITGSAVWALIMGVGLPPLLERIKFRLRI